MDLPSTRAYYQNLLITQYRIKPKAQQTIALMVNQALCDGLPFALARCFDLNSALGAQLDIIGRIVGVPRYVYGLDLEHTFFSYVRYNDTTARPGFGRYNDNPYLQSIWLRYISNANTQMTDFEMLACIQLKIIQNNSFTSLKDVAEALFMFFGHNITVHDNRNMSLVYLADELYSPILEIANFLDILPRPMGVSVSLVINSVSSSSCSSSRSSSSSSRSSSSSCSSSSCRSSSSSSSSCRSSSSSSCRSSSSSSSSSAT